MLNLTKSYYLKNVSKNIEYQIGRTPSDLIKKNGARKMMARLPAKNKLKT